MRVDNRGGNNSMDRGRGGGSGGRQNWRDDNTRRDTDGPFNKRGDDGFYRDDRTRRDDRNYRRGNDDDEGRSRRNDRRNDNRNRDRSNDNRRTSRWTSNSRENSISSDTKKDETNEGNNKKTIIQSEPDWDELSPTNDYEDDGPPGFENEYKNNNKQDGDNDETMIKNDTKSDNNLYEMDKNSNEKMNESDGGTTPLYDEPHIITNNVPDKSIQFIEHDNENKGNESSYVEKETVAHNIINNNNEQETIESHTADPEISEE